MILVRREGLEEKLSYEQFIREIQEGRIQVDTMVWSDVLTSGVWKPAGDLQFFRSWAPKGSVRPDARIRHAAAPAPPVSGPASGTEAGSVSEFEASGSPESTTPAEGPDAGARMPSPSGPEEPSPSAGSGPAPWIPYGHESEPPPSAGAHGPTPGSEEGGTGSAGPGTSGGFGWSQSFSGDIPPGPPLPWEEMDKHGFFRAAGKTIRLAFADPEEFFRCVGRGHGVMPALVFGLVFSAFAAVVESLYGAAILHFFSDMVETYQSQLPEWLRTGTEPSLRESLLMRGIFLLVYPVGIFLAAGLVHAVLRTFGQPARDFKTTFRMINYSSAVDVLVVLPFCGNILAMIWELVLLTRGLARLHRMRPIAVLVAVLLPGVLLMCLWMQAMVLAGVMEGISGLGSRS